MFSAGLVEEVAGCLAGPQPLSKTARQAVGYREVIEHLAGGRAWPETIELVKLHTRQLAKRQGTWFRSLSECRLLAGFRRALPGGNRSQANGGERFVGWWGSLRSAHAYDCLCQTARWLLLPLPVWKSINC